MLVCRRLSMYEHTHYFDSINVLCLLSPILTFRFFFHSAETKLTLTFFTQRNTNLLHEIPRGLQYSIMPSCIICIFTFFQPKDLNPSLTIHACVCIQLCYSSVFACFSPYLSEKCWLMAGMLSKFSCFFLSYHFHIQKYIYTGTMIVPYKMQIRF